MLCGGLYHKIVTGKAILLSLVTKGLTFVFYWKVHEVLSAGFFLVLLCTQGFHGGNLLMFLCFNVMLE